MIRVAHLKTQSSRRQRVAAEVRLNDKQILNTTEYMHPRLEEIGSILPLGMAKALFKRERLCAWLDKRINKGRHVRTYSLRWFFALHTVAGMKGLRRRSLRHHTELAHRDAWLDDAVSGLDQSYELGVAMLSFRRLIKGYSDTHVRGLSKFDKVMTTAKEIAEREDAAHWARLLLTSAVQDASGEKLDGLIKTIQSFANA